MKDKMIVHHPACYGIPEGDEYMTWLSHWKFGSHEAGPGDEINVSIFNQDDDQMLQRYLGQDIPVVAGEPTSPHNKPE